MRGLKAYRSNSVEETLTLAGRLGKTLRPGAVVALTGEIGCGKTVFIKGLSQGLGVKKRNEVKSPTFVLMHLYEGKMPIQHFDLYRLEKAGELDAIGFDEFVSNSEAVTFIEWADRAPKRIPKNALWVEIKITGPSARKITIKK